MREHDLQVVEANPLARDLLNLSNDNEVHSALEFGADTIRIRNMLDETNRSGEAPSTLVHLGPKRAAWRVKATIVRGMHEQHFLLQFSKIDSRVTFDVIGGYGVLFVGATDTQAGLSRYRLKLHLDGYARFCVTRVGGIWCFWGNRHKLS